MKTTKTILTFASILALSACGVDQSQLRTARHQTQESEPSNSIALSKEYRDLRLVRVSVGDNEAAKGSECAEWNLIISSSGPVKLVRDSGIEHSDDVQNYAEGTVVYRGKSYGARDTFVVALAKNASISVESGIFDAKALCKEKGVAARVRFSAESKVANDGLKYKRASADGKVSYELETIR